MGKKINIFVVNRTLSWTFSFASVLTLIAAVIVINLFEVIDDNWVFAGLIFGAVLGALVGRFYFKSEGEHYPHFPSWTMVFFCSFLIGFFLNFATGNKWWFYGFGTCGLVLGFVMRFLAERQKEQEEQEKP